ncbi:cytochrome b [Parahaliea mediterranea]|uniref:cytochrome b n=1 Tax=Parahaliea mediterranea TaxID=651086 RepID=UPI000E2FF3B8|nr:cytochrome b [Parahaliea mediterranea]
MTSHQPGYDRTARLLHWSSALCFLIALGIGLYFGTLDYRNNKADYAKFGEVIYWHKTFGTLVFALVFYRLYHRFRHPPPALPASMPGWMRSASHLSHWSLYGLIVVLGLSGLVGSDIGNYPVKLFELWYLPQFAGENRPLADSILRVHIWLGNTAAILVAIHIGASLYHHWIVKDDVLRRMWAGPGR